MTALRECSVRVALGLDAYHDFLRDKIQLATDHGFDVDPDDVHPILKGHQRATVVWAVRGGRRAIFAAFGLGKSLIQLEILRLILARTGGRGLIVAPLGVRQEFVRDAAMTDTAQMLSLNTSQSQAAAEKHLCPMPFDIADRLIMQFSQPGELVMDPFSGLGTVPYRALKLGRRGLGIELNPRYFLDGVKYCEAMTREISMPSLFDILDAAVICEAAD